MAETRTAHAHSARTNSAVAARREARWPYALAGVAMAALVAICVLYVTVPGDPLHLGFGPSHLVFWLVILSCFALAIAAAGRAYYGRWAGLFVNPRNRMSLSQTQFILWTTLLASAALAMALIRLRLPGSGDGALGLSIPVQVPGVLGISAVSLGTAAGIQAQKRGRIAAPDEVERGLRSTLARAPMEHIAAGSEIPADQLARTLPSMRAALAAPVPLATRLDELHSGHPDARRLDPSQVTAVQMTKKLWPELGKRREGLLYRNPAKGMARLSDLVHGDEWTNSYKLDLGKTQNLLFTLIALVIYAVLIGKLLLQGGQPGAGTCAVDTGCLDHLPPLADGIFGLLGASHVGYLATKASGATRALN